MGSNHASDNSNNDTLVVVDDDDDVDDYETIMIVSYDEIGMNI